MAELIWKGKYVDGARVRAPRGRAPLVDVERYGDVQHAPVGRLIHGDATRVLASLLPELAGQVDLVYVDPPFDTGSDFTYRVSIPGAPEDTPRLELPAYSDARGLDAWLCFFSGLAELWNELLAPGGSLYVHLDAHAAHYAKVVLDEVLGQDAFQREIVWRIGWISGFKSRARSWIRNHDTILFYAKGGRPSTFHKEYLPYPAGYVRRDGAAPKGPGYPIEDVWNATDLDRMDSIQIVSFSGEKVGYPTQKNESLVGRIVRASSDPGDLVLDCFVGSGTTAHVAGKLGRRWIASDASPLAVHATRKRLLSGPEPRAFVVQRVDGEPEVTGGKLSARARVEGRTCTVDLRSFDPGAPVVPEAVGAAVTHWSQWIEGWCVDWDHRGGALPAGASVWRRRVQDPLALSVAHDYERRGSHVVLVKAFDVLGRSSTRTLKVDVE
jgi:DNA modification methylase